MCLFSPPEPVGEGAQALSDNDQTPDKNKKKNRCFSCRKKVGLTGKEDKSFTHTEWSVSLDMVQRFMSHEPALLGFSVIITTWHLEIQNNCLLTHCAIFLSYLVVTFTTFIFLVLWRKVSKCWWGISQCVSQ